jgi:precorrin-2 dehydrogenase/sirohydrochlorin ferrochelatase
VPYQIKGSQKKKFTGLHIFDRYISMPYLPVFLDLTGRKCLVIGAGSVGKRKIAVLLASGASNILVLDPHVAKPSFDTDISHPAVNFIQRPFYPEDLQGVSLVIASSADPQLNKEICRLCQEDTILCNIVDDPERGSFIVPALHRQGDLILTVSTSGASPALAKKIKNELAAKYGPEYDLWLRLLARIRKLLLGYHYPTQENTRIFRSLIEDDIYNSLTSQDESQLISILYQKLPETLHHAIREIIYDLFDPV